MGAEARLAGRRVLIVEDEAMIAALIEMILSEAGCSVVGTVASAERALEMIEQGSIDAVVLDVCAGDNRSYSVADALLARGVPFVFVSGLAREDMPVDYRACGYVTKPFKPEALLDALGKMAGHAPAS